MRENHEKLVAPPDFLHAAPSEGDEVRLSLTESRMRFDGTPPSSTGNPAPVSINCETALAGFAVLADIFVPDLGVFADIGAHQAYTFLRIQIKHPHAGRAQPVEAAAKRPALPNDQSADAELTDQSTAIPARRQRSHHHNFAVRTQPSCAAKSIGLRVHGGVTLLDPSIVSSTEQLSLGIEHGRADGKAPFRQADSGFANCY